MRFINKQKLWTSGGVSLVFFIMLSFQEELVSSKEIISKSSRRKSGIRESSVFATKADSVDDEIIHNGFTLAEDYETEVPIKQKKYPFLASKNINEEIIGKPQRAKKTKNEKKVFDCMDINGRFVVNDKRPECILFYFEQKKLEQEAFEKNINGDPEGTSSYEGITPAPGEFAEDLDQPPPIQQTPSPSSADDPFKSNEGKDNDYDEDSVTGEDVRSEDLETQTQMANENDYNDEVETQDEYGFDD